MLPAASVTAAIRFITPCPTRPALLFVRRLPFWSLLASVNLCVSAKACSHFSRGPPSRP